MIDRPMLAEKVRDVALLRYPLLASPKLDGIRCLTWDEQAFTRSLKHVPNAHIQQRLSQVPAGLDGELMLRDPKASFQSITSAVMSRDGKPDFVYRVFDTFRYPAAPFHRRVRAAKDLCRRDTNGLLKFVPHRVIHNAKDLLDFEAYCLDRGYEGVMVRSLNGPYKHGRSTWREGYLLKLKRFVDDEAQVIGFEELMHNVNEAQISELGLTKRSSAKAGKIPAGKLGKFLVRMRDGREFRIGVLNGVTQEDRRQMWLDRESYLGRWMRFRYQNHGIKVNPRSPVFEGWRDERDM